MQSKAQTVEGYILELPVERREVVKTVREVILENLPEGYEEVMQYGVISYVVPFSIYPSGYHANPLQPLPYLSLASQKNYFALYFMHIYGDPATLKWFTGEYKKSGKKLDMGKSCVRFKKLADLPLDLMGKVVGLTPVKKWIEIYEKARESNRKKK